MVVTLDIITDIYSLPDKNGNQKLIKRNLKYKKTFDTNFMQVQHFIDTKGNISKKYCLINEGDSSYKAAHKFEEIEKLVRPMKINGFKNTKKI